MNSNKASLLYELDNEVKNGGNSKTVKNVNNPERIDFIQKNEQAKKKKFERSLLEDSKVNRAVARELLKPNGAKRLVTP